MKRYQRLRMLRYEWKNMSNDELLRFAASHLGANRVEISISPECYDPAIQRIEAWAITPTHRSLFTFQLPCLSTPDVTEIRRFLERVAHEAFWEHSDKHDKCFI